MVCCSEVFQRAGTWHVPLVDPSAPSPRGAHLPSHTSPTATLFVPLPAALGFNSHWQPEPEQQDRQQQAQATGQPASPRRHVCPSAVRRLLVDSSEDSAQTPGAAGTWPPAVLHSKRANPGLADSPSSKRHRGPHPAAAPAATAAAAAAAAAASGSHTSDAGPSSMEGQLRQHMPPAAWRQALAHYTATAAGSLSAQETLLWPAPSLQQLLSPQHSAGSSSSSVDAAVQTALGLLGWGCLPASGGMVACHTLNPAAYQLLALHGADLAFVWQPQAAAQQHPAWWALQGAYGAAGPHPATTAPLDEGVAGSCQPSFHLWGEQAAAGAAHQHVQLAQQQQQQQRFLVRLPDAAAADHLPEPAAVAGFAFTPAPLEQPPPLPQHWHADSRGSGSSAAAVAHLQQPPTLEAATAAAADASTRSISFPPPSSLARGSPFAARPAAPPAAAGRAAALAPMPSLLPAAVPAAAEPPPVRDAARVCQDVLALFDLPEDTPLNDDLLCMYISWNDEGAASLHL